MRSNRSEIVDQVLAAESKTKIEHLLATFDHLATPKEVAEVMKFQVKVYRLNRYRRQAVWNWAKRHKDQQIRIKRKCASFDFSARNLNESISVYSPQNPSGTALCFTTNAGNMMTTLSVFLTSTAPSNFNIVLVHNRGGYQKGIPGISDDNWGGFEGLCTLLEKHDLLPDLIVGSSAGCLYGVAFASVFHEAELMLFGPANIETSATWKALASYEDFQIRNNPTGISWIGAKSESDPIAAKALQKKFPNIAIELVQDSGHNSISPLIQQGLFDQALEKHLESIRSRSASN